MASSTFTEAGTSDPTAAQVAQVRAFNRFYTNVIGVLHGPYLDSPFTLTEGRLLFEIARQDTVEVSDLRRALDIDAGYLSRVLTRFEAESLVTRHRSATDARRQEIRATSDGRNRGPPGLPSTTAVYSSPSGAAARVVSISRHTCGTQSAVASSASACSMGSQGAESASVSGDPALPTTLCSPDSSTVTTVHHPTRSTRGASSASTCSLAGLPSAAAM